MRKSLPPGPASKSPINDMPLIYRDQRHLPRYPLEMWNITDPRVQPSTKCPCRGDEIMDVLRMRVSRSFKELFDFTWLTLLCESNWVLAHQQ